MSTMKAKHIARVYVVPIQNGYSRNYLRFMPTYMIVGFYLHIRHGFIMVRNMLTLWR
ncbi:hypothetical protein Hanom_Chr12g01073711 [Helianthus anomalus]